ncbi:MAG: hypothetical protein OXT03_04975, partial [Alphaproteobacteria bacterium]|nr:hypothetical protein [Alphaproteobacteria bacterium]
MSELSMVYETHESRKMTEIADAINDIMQSGETAQNGDEVANMPPRHAEYSTPASQKPPQAKTRPAADEINDKANNDIDIDDTPIADSPMPDSSMPDSSVSAVRTEAAEQAEMGASEGMERAENDLSQAENSLPHKIDESTPDPTASQTDFAVYGDNENIEQNAEQNNNTDIEAGLEAAIAAEIASDPIAQQTLNKAANNESSNESNNDWHGETNGNPSDNYEAQAQAGWSQQTNPHTSARQAVGALWD